VNDDSTSLVSVDENARRRFEAAWRRRCPEPIEHFLPQPDQTNFLATLEELIHIELEMLWKSQDKSSDATTNPAPSPRVEMYLARFPQLNQPAVLLRLLKQEFRVRHLYGDSPSLEEYRSRFPAVILTDSEGGTPLRPPPPPVEEAPRVPGYDILGVLGRGGMGVVYKARQQALNRVVALKTILAGAHADPEERTRFLQEAEAVARLQHPAIVQIYEVSREGDRPYFVLEYVDGGSLADRLRGGNPLPAHQSARMLETLARAVQFAHQRGIIHRDLKPANVLLTAAAGAPKVTDFGLAKYLEAGQAGLTHTGAVLGTPSYMAPEQAGGKAKTVGPAADVYALGAILYAMLTGRPPFLGETPLDTLDQVVSQEPVPPSRLRPKVPRDLETICLKCLQKEPARRYPSAEALAEDLARFLRDEPIRARPVGNVERWWRWCRRQPVVAGLTAAVTALLVAVAVGATVAAIWLKAVAREAEEARAKETAERLRAQGQQGIAETRRQEAENARRGERTTLIDLHTTHGLTADDLGRPGQAVLWFAHAAQLAGQDAERQHANRARFRWWSRLLPTPVRALPHPGRDLTHLAFDPAGKYLLTITNRHRYTIWDLAREQPLPWASGEGTARCAAWTAGGRAVVLAAGRQVEVRQLPGGEVCQRLTRPTEVRALAVSSDGRFLAMAGGGVRVWDFGKRDFATAELVHPRPVVALSFHPGNNRLATACADNQARVFAVPGPSGAGPLFPPLPHWPENPSFFVRPLAPTFIDQGRGLLTLTAREQLTWSAAETGKSVRTVPFGSRNSIIETVQASPDGKYFVIAGYSGAQLWDATQRQPVGQFLQHRNHVPSACFSPDGRAVLTVSEDRRGQLWALRGGQALGTPLIHQAPVRLAAYSADGQLLATAQEDGLVRVWLPPQSQVGQRRLALYGAPTFARLSPDGRYLFGAGMGGYPGQLRLLRVYESATGRPAGSLLEVGGLLTDAALSPDGRGAVTCCSLAVTPRERFAPQLDSGDRAGRVQFWDWRTGKPLFDPVATPSEPRGVAYRPDGKQAAVICGGGQVLLLDPARGQVERRLEHGALPWSERLYPSVRFTPDGRSLVTFGSDRIVRVWATATGQARFPPLAHEQLCYDADISRDGRWLVTSSRDNTVRVWDLCTGQPLAGPLGHPDWVFGGRFSRNGAQVLTACRDGKARLWDRKSGKLVCPPFKHHDAVFAAAFAPDERWVVTASRDGTVRVWERHTAKPITPPAPVGGIVWNALVTPDGSHVAAGGEFRALVLMPLDDLHRDDGLPPEDLCLWGELLSGHRLQGGDVEGLTTQEWLNRWRQFCRRHPRGELASVPPSAWHRLQAEECAAARQWSAALWHLDRLLREAPQDPALRLARADVYENLEEWPKAAADYSAVLKVQSASWEARFDRGKALLLAGKYDGAIADFTAALREDPHHAMVLHQRGRAHFEKGDYGKAIADCTAALRLDPLYAWAYHLRSLAYEKQGDKAKAEADRRMAGHLKPSLAR
jgi:WD40 repeat protein/Tfp pilus assembly protein PilF/tRNA A-37 threonylcarbamoyl transferase component Bud32